MSKPKKAAPKATAPKTAPKEDVQFGTANTMPVGEPIRPRLIGPKELPLFGIHYSINHLRRMWNSGKFPKPSYTSERRFGWDPAELDDWIKDKIKNNTAARGRKPVKA
jgi:hypothetical protein